MVDSYADKICLEGIFSSTIDLIVYTGTLSYFICSAGRSKFGTCTILMLLVPLIQYMLCSSGRCIDYFFNSNSDKRCSLYFFKSWYDWVEELSTIATGLIINVFMLRNMQVAAVLRAETVEEEHKMRERIYKFQIVYLPLYFLLQILIYVLEI